MWSFSFAQQFTNYSIKDGLPSNHIYTIRQDTKGFLWFLTDKGMVRYNGSEFKNFTTKNGLPKNDVWDAFTTPDSKVWYITKTTELGYIENDSVFSFPTKNEGEIMNPIFSSQIGEKIYPTGPTKTYALKNNKWEIILNNIGAKDRINIIHPSVKYLKLTKLQDTLKIINHKNSVIKKLTNKPYINVLARRKQLNDSLYCWVTENDYLILNLNTLKLRFSTFKDEIGLEKAKHARINIINNKIQISGTGFVGFLDKELHIKDAYLFPKHIDSHFAIVDKTNTIWLATFSNGIYKLPYVKRNITYLNNLNTSKLSIINNELYTNIYNKGFYKFNSKINSFEQFLKIEDYTFKPTEIKELNTSFFPSKFTISTLKNNVLKTIDYRNTRLITNPLSYNIVYFKNNLYGLFPFGLNRINPSTLEIEKEFYQSGCNFLIKFKNRLLIATNNGLKEYKNDTIKSINFTNQAFEKSILSINNISEKLLLLNTDGFGSFITDLKTINRLPNSNFLIVENAFVEKNQLWLATNEGVYKYTNYKLETIINANNGLPSNNINDVLIHKNKIFISTNNGVAILPKDQKNISQFLKIYIEKAAYNGSKINNHKRTFKYIKDNNTTFSIASINFNENNKDFTYQYKLHPVQKNWITTKSNNINFTDLEPNNYTLEVKSNNHSENYSFQITALWYQRSISKFLIFFLILGTLILILFKIRDRELTKKTNKIKAQKKLAEYELHALRSQMNPHFVFNSLNSIQYYITKNEIELSEKYLVRFSRLIRKFFDFSRDKFISLEQEISLLNNYLEIEKMRFGDEFNYKFNIDKNLNLNDQKIPSMLLQPIVENSVNHGLFHNEGKGTILINFKHQAINQYTVEIIDNGVGLKKAKQIKDQSIKTHISKSSDIIKDRIHLLNQSHEWFVTYNIYEIENNGGTCVKLTFKNNE
ncbi:histidine kinase [Lutibacter sp. A64]|uniref:sensor histidine kinase n=1 Tax=Lutibacter sp. A64 TaxID=2918526 RepID=UPI001F05C19E|nr:histidine kinase [Lutibacter sp. A64]UMB55439.1 histidine kinase [Lutibacter sp. A64]